MGLKEYNKKRDFKSTNEPKGNLKKDNNNRFVIQYHLARAKHYDFRLEHNGVLISFAVPKGLSLNPSVKRLAVMVEDHPVDYINFEGIIPKGNYGAGTVEIYDIGNYESLEDMDKSIKKGHIKIVLNGEKIKGAFSLIKTDEKNWLIIKSKDEYATTRIKKEKYKLPFDNASVQLATLSNVIPKSKEWIFEIKYDGYRMISYVENKKVKILSRNNVDYTNKFKSIADSLKKIDEKCFVVDGEIVSFDENGRSDFKLLQDNLKSNNNNFYYVIFDLLALNNEDLREEKLIKRKDKLERLLFKAYDNLIYSKHVNKGNETFKFAKDNKLEGIIAKKVNSLYLGKRSDDWLKIKCYLRQEFVIAGYVTSDKNQLLSALILGYYNSDKEFIYAGKVGTGFSEKAKEELYNKFKSITKKTSPFKEKIAIKNVTWLSLKYVAEIQFAEFTKDKLLRQPSFIGLRKDKKAKDVILEKIDEKL